jgi:hypothetical protein
MDLIDLANGVEHQKDLSTEIVDILKFNCATNRFYKNDDIKIKQTTGGYSIYVAGFKVFQVNDTKTKGSILLCKGAVVDKFDLQKYIDQTKYSDDEQAFVKVTLLDDLIAKLPELSIPIFMYCLEQFRMGNLGYGNFGCCNSFIMCSDAKTCLADDRELYLGCSYRKHLEKGEIFYGKNKNI